MERVEVLTAEQETKLIHDVDPFGDYNFRHNYGACEPITNATEWKAARNAVIVLLMSEAGLRVGEVVKLLYSDCYFACKPVLKLQVRSDVAKGGQEREVPLTLRLMFALARYWYGRETVDDKVKGQILITRTRFGEKLTVRGIEKYLEKIGRVCLGIKLYPHMLRHTCATKLMRITDMPTVQKILGHKHLSSTEIYTHPNSEDMDIAIKSMEVGCRQWRGSPGSGNEHSRRLRGDNKGEKKDNPGGHGLNPGIYSEETAEASIEIEKRQDDNSAGY
jgi:integrase